MLFNLFEFIVNNLVFFTGSYSNNVFPEPLSKEEEEKYVERMINGDKDARAKLIEHNLRLVAHIVKKFETSTNDVDDLIGIGTVGLIKGIDSFNPNKNIKITTYVARCVENEILMYFRSSKKSANDVSLNDYIGFDKDGNEVALLDVLADDKPDMFTDIVKKTDIEDLFRYIKILNEREKDILVKRYGLYGSKEYTQKEIAKYLGISRSYVSRIEKRALIKLLREFYKDKNNSI